MQDVPAAPGPSSDGRWWWTGSYWAPARSPDGRWQYDGRVWCRRRLSLRTESEAERLAVVAWLPVWLLCVVFTAGASARGGRPTQAAALVGATLLLTVVLDLLAVTIWLSVRARWPQVVLHGCVVVVVLLSSYVAGMLASPVPAGAPDTQDDLAAVGLVILGPPTVLAVAAVQAVGVMLGLLALRRQRRSPSPGVRGRN